MTATAIHGGTTPLAALTTVFSPPCPTSWLLTGTGAPPSQLPVFPRASMGCDPPLWSRNLEGGGFHYYSPAICPRGFSVGPGCGLTQTRTEEGFPAVMPEETVAYCVPIGMSCTTDTTDFRGGVWGWTQSGTGAAAAITVGPAIQIRWAQSDLAILETHPLTPGLNRQAVATGRVENPLTRAGSSDIPVITGLPGPQGTSRNGNQTGTADGSAQESRRGSWPLDKNTTAFLVVVLVVLVALIIGILGLIIIRRHKAGKLTGYTAIVVGWLMPKDEPDNHAGVDGKLRYGDDTEGAQLGGLERPLPALPQELGDGSSRGSLLNPAELDGWGVGKRPRRWKGIPRTPKRSKPPLISESAMKVHRLSPVRESVDEDVEDRPTEMTERSPPLSSRPSISHQNSSPLIGLQRPAPIAKPTMPSPLTQQHWETRIKLGNEARAWSYWKPPEEANSRGVI